MLEWSTDLCSANKNEKRRYMYYDEGGEKRSERGKKRKHVARKT